MFDLLTYCTLIQSCPEQLFSVLGSCSGFPVNTSKGSLNSGHALTVNINDLLNGNTVITVVINKYAFLPMSEPTEFSVLGFKN